MATNGKEWLWTDYTNGSEGIRRGDEWKRRANEWTWRVNTKGQTRRGTWYFAVFIHFSLRFYSFISNKFSLCIDPSFSFIFLHSYSYPFVSLRLPSYDPSEARRVDFWSTEGHLGMMVCIEKWRISMYMLNFKSCQNLIITIISVLGDLIATTNII